MLTKKRWLVIYEDADTGEFKELHMLALDIDDATKIARRYIRIADRIVSVQEK